MADDRDGVLVVPAEGIGLLWHPLPLPPGPSGEPMEPREWCGRIGLTAGRWAVAPRPSPGWTPPSSEWGESVATAGTP